MPKKQNKKKKIEESEEESGSERSEEESEDKDSEGSDDGSDKEDGSDDDEENSDKSDKSDDDDESGSDKDSDDGSKSGSDDESGSGSDDEDEDESDEDSDDSGKKKKKKGGKKDKKGDKKKGKKGGKEDKKGKKDDKKEPEKKVTIAAPISGPTPTLASVMQDLDDLSAQLAKTFPSFRQESHVPDLKSSSTFQQTSPFEGVRLQPSPITPYGNYGNHGNYGNTGNNAHHYHPPTKEELPIRSMRKPYSEPIFNADYNKSGTYHAGEHKALHRDISIQYEVPVVRNPSPEAVRAVHEYKQRKEQEKRGLIDRSVGSIHDMVIEPFSTTSGTLNKKESRSRQGNTAGSDVHDYVRGDMPEIVEREERTEKTGRGSQERTEFQDPRDYEYGMQRSRKNFAKSSQLAEDYYGHVRKISTSPQRKTLQDLYKHKPKPMYVESGNKQTVDRYHANAQSYGNSSNYRVNSSAEKQGQQNFRQTGSSYKQQNDPDNKRLINNAMEVLLKKSQNNYK